MRFPAAALAALLAAGLGACPRAGAPVAPDSLDLDAFLAAAWPAAHRLAAARADLAGAAAARGSAAALRTPTLALDLSGGWVSRHQTLEVGPRTVEFGDGRSADAALLGGWTLYAGGALAAGEVAAAAEERARGQDLAADSLRLGEELRAAFYGALAAQAGCAAVETAVSRLERHREDVERRRGAGSAGEEALLLAVARLEAARQDLAQRRGELAAARLDLGALCGEPGRPLIPRGPLEPTEAIAPAVVRPRELAALDARLDLARALVRQRKGAARPRVEALASWHLARPGVDPVANTWMNYATVGLRLRWSLWDGRLSARRADEARLAAAALERRRAEAERRAAAALARAREQAAAARAAWEAAVRRVEAEEARGILVEQRRRQGMATERDWLDAVDDRRLAAQERALAAARLRLAESRLLAAAGH